jgi:hypothetical protein
MRYRIAVLLPKLLFSRTLQLLRLSRDRAACRSRNGNGVRHCSARSASGGRMPAGDPAAGSERGCPSRPQTHRQHVRWSISTVRRGQPPTGFKVLTGDAISTAVTVGRRYYNRARFGDRLGGTPSQLAPGVVDARWYAPPWKCPSLGGSCVLRNSKVPQRRRAFPRLSGCVHAYFMKRVG